MSQLKKRPKDQAGWDQRYLDNQLPWDSGKPDVHLPKAIEAHGVGKGRALEIGCGTGTNAIWLAQQGFRTTGLDLSPTAIRMAEEKAAGVGVDCRLLVCDFMSEEVPDAPFDFVYDRGCFHVFDEPEELSRFALGVSDLLAPTGIWHSLIGSTDGPPRDTGPPRHTAAEIISAVEPHFEILELTSTHFDDGDLQHAKAWVLVAQRRRVYSE